METIQKGKHTLAVEFDGGNGCNDPKNYGTGYGSYKISGGKVRKLDFKRPMSNNAAEVWTLVEAVKVIRDNWNPAEITLFIIGDSQNALMQAERACGQRKAKISKGSSQEFVDSIQALTEILPLFHFIKAQWQPRIKSVRSFGH